MGTSLEQVKISVIVPVYKVEDYLDKCVASILAQTHKNLEVILVDDGSPDRCGELCDTWAEKDCRVKVVHKENGGVSSARNAGLDAATGAYIGFVDPDDHILETMYESLLSEAETAGADIVECGYYEVSPAGQAIRSCGKREAFSAREALKIFFSRDDRVTNYLWCRLFKRSFVGEVRFQTQFTCSEEPPFLYELLRQKGTYLCVPEAYYFYIRREDSLIGRTFSEKRLQVVGSACYVEQKCKTELPELYPYARGFSALHGYYLFKDEMILGGAAGAYPQAYRFLLAHLRRYWVMDVYRCAGWKMAMAWGICKWMPKVFGWLKKYSKK